MIKQILGNTTSHKMGSEIFDGMLFENVCCHTLYYHVVPCDEHRLDTSTCDFPHESRHHDLHQHQKQTPYDYDDIDFFHIAHP